MAPLMVTGYTAMDSVQPAEYVLTPKNAVNILQCLTAVSTYLNLKVST